MNSVINNKLYISTLVFALILILRDILGANVNQLLILGYIAIVAIILDYEELFYFTSFLTPLVAGINSFALTVLLVALFIKSNKRQLSQFIPVFILIVVELLHPIIYTFPIGNEIIYFSVIGLFFFCSSAPDNVDSSCVVKFFILGASLTCLLIIVRSCIINGSFIALFLDNARSVVAMGANEVAIQNQETHMALNADALAYISLLGISCLLLGSKVLKINKILYIILLIINLMAGMASVTRTWVLVMSLIIFLYLFVSKIKYKWFLLLPILIVILLQSEIFNIILEAFYERFTNEDLLEAGGRGNIWKQYITIWSSKLEYIILGISSPNYRSIFPDINSMHNFTQQIFVCTGVVGFVVYFAFMLKVIIYGIKKRMSLRVFLPIIGGFVFLQSISVLANWILILPIFPCIYALRLKNY